VDAKFNGKTNQTASGKHIAKNKNMLETVLKSKLVGYVLVFWGATFVLRSIADFEYYIFS